MEPPKKRRFLGSIAADSATGLGNGLLITAAASVGPEGYDQLMLLGGGHHSQKQQQPAGVDLVCSSSVGEDYSSGGGKEKHGAVVSSEVLQQHLNNDRGGGRGPLQQHLVSGGPKDHLKHFVSCVSREQRHHLLGSDPQEQPQHLIEPQHHLVSYSGVGGEKAVVTTAARRNRRKYSLQFKVSVLGKIIILKGYRVAHKTYC